MQNDILPLPGASTLRRYPSMIKLKCGLGEAFFKALTIKMKTNEEYKRHGILGV